MAIPVAVQEHRIDWVTDAAAFGGLRQVLEPVHPELDHRLGDMITVCGATAGPGQTCDAENGVAGHRCGLDAAVEVARTGFPVLLPLCPGHWAQHRDGRSVRLAEAGA